MFLTELEFQAEDRGLEKVPMLLSYFVGWLLPV